MKCAGKVIIGRLARPHGLQGWIRVISFVEPVDNLLNDGVALQIKHKNKWQHRKLEAGMLLCKPLPIVKLGGINTLETAQYYTNDLIAVERSALSTLKEGDYYWTDLISSEVINTDGIKFGIVHSLIETGSNDVLVVKNEAQERLIPYISQVIRSVDLKKKIITVKWETNF